MGWLGLDEPQHIEGYLNGILFDHSAVAVEFDAASFADWVREQVSEGEILDSFGVWIIGTIRPGTAEAREYIGIILIEFDHDRSDVNSSVYEKAWRYKVISAMEGPIRYDCPVEWLDRVPCNTDGYEESWRKNVRMHHAKV